MLPFSGKPKFCSDGCGYAVALRPGSLPGCERASPAGIAHVEAWALLGAQEPPRCPAGGGSSRAAVAHVTRSPAVRWGFNSPVLRRQHGKTRVIWRGALPCQVLKY